MALSRTTTTQTGHYGEDLAVQWLRKKGYEIVARNYRRRFGEVDIIARHNGYLVFIEVKTRSSNRFGLPVDALTARKQRQLIKIAEDYLLHHNCLDIPCRFDVLSVSLRQGKKPEISILVNAFDAC
jgi:putative endonuclease